MNIEDIEQRLKLLVKLCHETEPTIDDIKKMREDPETLTGAVDELFTNDMLLARDLYNKVRDGDISSRREATNIMRSANTIWKQRNHIKKVGWEEFYSLEGQVIDLIRQNQKINAIKLYRQAKIDRGEDVGLKEAKEYVDALQEKLITK
jgi:dynactin complex subunit